MHWAINLPSWCARRGGLRVDVTSYRQELVRCVTDTEPGARQPGLGAPRAAAASRDPPASPDWRVGATERGKAKRQSLIRTPGRAMMFPSGELAHDVRGILVGAQGSSRTTSEGSWSGLRGARARRQRDPGRGSGELAHDVGGGLVAAQGSSRTTSAGALS